MGALSTVAALVFGSPTVRQALIFTVGVVGMWVLLRTGPRHAIGDIHVIAVLILLALFPAMIAQATLYFAGFNASLMQSFLIGTGAYALLVAKDQLRYWTPRNRAVSASAINASLSTTPVNLGVEGKTLKDVLNKSPEITENALDIIFVDRALTDRLVELVTQLHPQRQTIIVAETPAMASDLLALLKGRPNVLVINGYREAIFKGGKIYLSDLEEYFRGHAIYYPFVHNVMVGDQGINVVRSVQGPELIFDGLSEKSMFVRPNTNYLLINEILQVLKAFKSPSLGELIHGGWKALIAA
jgi:hypothetical protein